MSMQEIIRKKRMEKNLSQKDLAEYLGVTSSAVSKWEKGRALPDVTLLGPLARLLEVSLEELLSFQRELSPEIEKGYLEELHKKLKEEPYLEAVRWAREILLTYPSSYHLILWITSLLESQAVMSEEKVHEESKDLFEKWYLRVLENGDQKEKLAAAERLYHFYLREEDYKKAEEMLTYFSQENPQWKRKKALLETKTGNLEEAWKTYEELLFATFQMANETFQEMTVLAMKEKDMDRAKLLIEKQSDLAKAFDMGRYYEASPRLELAVYEKDPGETKRVAQEMLKGIENLDHFTRSPLYAHMTFKPFSPDFKKEMRENLLEALGDQETFGYMEKEELEQVQKSFQEGWNKTGG